MTLPSEDLSSYPPVVQSLVCQLRVALGDSNPDEDYKFMPPEMPENVFAFNKHAMRRWKNCELLLCLALAQSRINGRFPSTNLGISQLYNEMLWLLISAARIEAFKIQVSKWIADEFSYSIAGKSLDLDKAAKYQSFLDSQEQSLDESIDKAKQKYAYKTLGIRRGGIWRQFPFPLTLGYYGPRSLF